MHHFTESLAPQFAPESHEDDLSTSVLRLAVMTWPEHSAGIVAAWLTEAGEQNLSTDNLRKAA